MHRPTAVPGLPHGHVRPVLRWGEPILHRALRPVTRFDDELAGLIADMFATMDAADGVGLAANQIGVDASVFVFDIRPGLDQVYEDADEVPGQGESALGEGDVLHADVRWDDEDDGLDHTGEPFAGVVCNPVLEPVAPDDPGQSDREGCLSLPGAFIPCVRPLVATVTGTDHTGAPVRYTASEYLARCFQHETDHCNGVVFGQHLGRLARRRLEHQAADLAPEYPPDWPVSPRRPSA